MTQLSLIVDSEDIGSYQRCDIVSNSSAVGHRVSRYGCRCSHVGGQSVGKLMGCNATVGVANVVAATTSKHFQPNRTSPEYFWWLFNLAKYANGQWWSTLSAGECGTTQGNSSRCSWYVAAVKRRIHKTCLEKSLVNAITAHNVSCFERCRGGSAVVNVSDPCVTRCLFSTVLGPLGGTGHWLPGGTTRGDGGMPIKILVQAWQRAFGPFGCPSLS